MNDLIYIDEEVSIILHETFTSIINLYLKDFILLSNNSLSEEEIIEKINEIVDIDHINSVTSEQKEVMFRFNVVSVSTDEIYEEISNYYNIEVEIVVSNNRNVNNIDSEAFKYITAIIWKCAELRYFNQISKLLKQDEKISSNIVFISNKINQFSFEKDMKSYTINYRVNIS